MSRSLRWCVIAGVLVLGLAAGGFAYEPVEPSAEVARTWWPAHRNVWTPIGWKDHLFRFAVLYNGWVVAQPHIGKTKEHTKPFAGQGVLLAIAPSATGAPAPAASCPYLLASMPDGGVGMQRWDESAAPVLVTSWPLRDGLVLEERVFAHLAGGQETRTGIEPLYAWVRLAVAHVDALKAPPGYSFVVQLQANHLGQAMDPARNLMAHPERAIYPRTLVAERYPDGSGSGCRLVEPDGRLRLVCVPSETATFTFAEGKPGTRDYFLQVSLTAQMGAHADLLVPMIPGNREEVERELTLGYEAALNDARAFWSKVPATAAVIDTPESEINDAIRHGVKLAQVITERNPQTGETSLLTGSWHYDLLWATPTSMIATMLLDPLGYHDFVERHIEIFRKHQGSVKPPGPAYTLHPGYLASPRSLTAIDWLADHGAILHEICRHALLTGDRAFIEQWQDTIVKACEFIRDTRRLRGHNGVPGVLPPAVATDMGIPTQSVWNVGWNYRGLTSAVRLLKRIGHPRADEFAAEARDYKEVFLKALREQAETMPQWTDSRGQPHRLTPVSLSTGDDVLHPFYLDAGPLVLVWAGLLEADDPLMRSALAFFREGPNTRLYDPRGNFEQRPVLVHEISSCEPCYSWSFYHSWQAGDRLKFLEGMYSLLFGAMSDQTYVSCESRHGIYGTVFTSVVLADLVRLAVIDEAISEDELHLLRLVPRAWLRADRITRFDNLSTEFGPVTLRFGLQDEGRRLEVSFAPQFRQRPKKVMLHVPPLAGLEQVSINGRVVKAAPGDVLPILTADRDARMNTTAP